MSNNKIETRFDEERYTTSDPHEMINKYITRRVLKTWKEDFIDEDTGEVTSIERNEVLFEKGRLIDQDTLAQIKFFISAGDIKEIEVSNQRRIASMQQNTYLHPHIASVETWDIKAKKIKFLFYCTSVEAAMPLLKDYIELNYTSSFQISSVQRFNSCIVIIDSLKKAKPDVPFELWDTVTPDDSDQENPDERKSDKKYYQIETRVFYDEDSTFSTFIVHSFNVDRCMMLIDDYLNKQQDERAKSEKEAGREYIRKDIRTQIEAAKTISIGCFIPLEFSEAYRDREVDEATAKNL